MIYFCRAGETEAVKIGTAINVERRIFLLQCGNPEPLKVIRTMDGAHRLETYLHHHFKTLHMRAEWFRYSPEMLTVQVPEARMIEGIVPLDGSAAEGVIAKFGGAYALAKMLGCHVTQVYRWTYSQERGGTGGTVPTKRQRQVLALAHTHGIPLTPADFFGASA